MDAYCIGLNSSCVLMFGELCEQKHPYFVHSDISSKCEVLISHNNLFLIIEKLPDGLRVQFFVTQL